MHSTTHDTTAQLLLLSLVEQQAIARAGGRTYTLLRLLPGVGHAFCREAVHPAAELRAVTTQLIAWTEDKLRARTA
jgi:hypothetical protein